MALVRCYKHGRSNIVDLINNSKYIEYIPSEDVPDILICGSVNCSEKGCILLKKEDVEGGEVLSVKTHSLKLNVRDLGSKRKPFTKEQF